MASRLEEISNISRIPTDEERKTVAVRKTRFCAVFTVLCVLAVVALLFVFGFRRVDNGPSADDILKLNSVIHDLREEIENVQNDAVETRLSMKTAAINIASINSDISLLQGQEGGFDLRAEKLETTAQDLGTSLNKFGKELKKLEHVIGEFQGECTSHDDCEDSEYCDIFQNCWYPCQDCSYWQDPIDGVCPTCPDIEEEWGEGECNTHDDCIDGYCDLWHYCYPCYTCQDYQDPIDGECPVCEGEEEWQEYGECWSHDDCDGLDYCDMWNWCYPCEECQYYQDPIDGTCPSCASECQNCAVPRDEPSCEVFPVADCVCGDYSVYSCCREEWSEACTEIAMGVCGCELEVGDCMNCDTPHGGAGCENEVISYCVCDLAPSCCSLWSQACVDIAHSQCRCPMQRECGNCLTAHASTGCVYEHVTECVCDKNSLCCKKMWAPECVEIAQNECGCQTGEEALRNKEQY